MEYSNIIHNFVADILDKTTMKTPNTELLSIMRDYVDFMDADKTMNLPVVISEHKKNHPSSFEYKSEIFASSPLGNTSFDCEIRDRDTLNYSFQIRSDRFKKQVVFRFDEGNNTHRNDDPSIPLAEQSVTTPHFHRYNVNGYFIAYKTEVLEQVARPMAIEVGFDAFLQEANIADGGIDPRIQICERGIISMNLQQTDPLAGVNF